MGGWSVGALERGRGRCVWALWARPKGAASGRGVTGRRGGAMARCKACQRGDGGPGPWGGKVSQRLGASGWDRRGQAGDAGDAVSCVPAGRRAPGVGTQQRSPRSGGQEAPLLRARPSLCAQPSTDADLCGPVALPFTLRSPPFPAELRPCSLHAAHRTACPHCSGRRRRPCFPPYCRITITRFAPRLPTCRSGKYGARHASMMPGP